jgi:hypothetical protein
MTMPQQAQPGDGSERKQTGTGRLANRPAKPGEVLGVPQQTAPIAAPAEQTSARDFDEHPATTAGDEDRARIVPPPNQGDASEVTERLGGESGDTVY